MKCVNDLPLWAASSLKAGTILPLYTTVQFSAHNHTDGVCSVAMSRLTLFVTPWTEARQAPLFMGLPRQEYWTGLPFPSPGNRPNPGIKPMPLTLGS